MLHSTSPVSSLTAVTEPLPEESDSVPKMTAGSGEPLIRRLGSTAAEESMPPAESMIWSGGVYVVVSELDVSSQTGMLVLTLMA